MLSWSQSSSDLEVKLLLPAGTRKDEVSVSISPQRLTVRLGWAGRVLDGPLKQRVKASEACWALGAVKVSLQEMQARLPAQQQQQLEQEQGLGVKRGVTGAGTAREGVAEGRAPVQAGASCQSEFEYEFKFVELLVVLPKEDGGHYWRALFEGGEEKSHMQVLQEALTNEGDARHAPTVDELGPEAAVLLEELRERQAMMSSGQWDPERNFDDFRLVLGDAML